ncbi:hypothetical protein AB0B25_24430 [Nocardia sp. NPDC049190]
MTTHQSLARLLVRVDVSPFVVATAGGREAAFTAIRRVGVLARVDG